MNEQDIINLINLSLAEEFELEMERLVPEAGLFTDLELDSLDVVDMVILLENAFSFKIREEEAIREIRTLKDLYEFVISKKHELEYKSK